MKVIHCPGCSILIRMSAETAATDPICPRCESPLILTLLPPTSTRPAPPPPREVEYRPAPEPDPEPEPEPEPDEYYIPRRRRKKGPPWVAIIAISVLAFAAFGGLIAVMVKAQNPPVKVVKKKDEKSAPSTRTERPVREERQDRDNIRDAVTDTSEDVGRLIKGLIALCILLPIYFAPTAIALFRRHNNLAPIIIVNTFLGGFLGIGWVVALAWSLSDMKPMRTERPV
ncbi:: Imm_superinfect [Gemmata massiliana]|uniref:: Imm_superinfect n=1 Tax=Gemmata massiliana TaxID=1210884 RepID=A0A6P2D0Q9_9BACT|nr:superinfection immunity protein [Gemmata massiliana]VTR93040.1 : Imm_superinfect [Gemmata massiliana]